MKAGFTRIEITPPPDEHPEMMGFGPFLGRTALEVLQPLFLRASYLVGDAGEAALILSLDVCGIDEALADRIRESAAKAVGINAGQVVAACTHTHSAPALMSIIGWGEFDAATAKRLPKLAAHAAKAAKVAATEVKLESGVSTLDNFSKNRVYGPTGPRDTTVRVLAFRRLDGTLAGLWSHFACHPVVLCEECRVISPDYCGVAMQALEDRLPGTICTFLQGASGDINPLWAHMKQERSIVHLAHAAYWFRSSVERAMTACVPETTTKVAIISERLNLPVEILSKAIRQAFSSAAQSGRLGKGWDKLDVISQVEMQQDEKRLLQQKTISRNVPVAALTVGQHTLIFHPFEMFTQIALDIRSGLNTEKTWVVGYTNDFAGYAPTADRFAPMSGDYAAHGVPFMRGRHPFAASLGENLVEGLTALGKQVQLSL